jgi:hypothetical protein
MKRPFENDPDLRKTFRRLSSTLVQGLGYKMVKAFQQMSFLPSMGLIDCCACFLSVIFNFHGYLRVKTCSCTSQKLPA